MAYTQTVTATAPGIWPPPAGIVLDSRRFIDGSGEGVLITVLGGSANYNVEVTGDDPFVALPVNWNGMDGQNGPLLNQTTSQNTNMYFPATAIRLRVTSLSPGATVTMSIIGTDM